MLSSVLSSERAVNVNIAIMRAFVKLREALELDVDIMAGETQVVLQLVNQRSQASILSTLTRQCGFERCDCRGRHG